MNVAYGAIHTLVRLVELVLTLTIFDGNYQHSQTGGVAMGNRLGPNCACLFMGHIDEQIFDHCTRRNTRFVKRYITYIDDIAGEKRSKILLHVPL